MRARRGGYVRRFPPRSAAECSYASYPKGLDDVRSRRSGQRAVEPVPVVEIVDEPGMGLAPETPGDKHEDMPRWHPRRGTGPATGVWPSRAVNRSGSQHG